MIKEIIKYPTTPSLEFGANVRHFDESLFSLIDHLKDTLEANKLNALSAFQIGSPLSVIVIKNEDGTYIELINSIVIKREGEVEPVETTAYFPELSAKTKRYEKIKLMYEDRDGEQQFLEADGELAITLQRKIDYNFGSNFRVRLNEQEKKIFDAKLEFGTDAITQNDCPTVFKRDRILQLFKVVFVATVIELIVSFFLNPEIKETIVAIENYSLASLLGLIIIYFFYAQYEGKQYKHCTSCQIGNIIGTSAILIFQLAILTLVKYFIT